MWKEYFLGGKHNSKHVIADVFCVEKNLLENFWEKNTIATSCYPQLLLAQRHAEEAVLAVLHILEDGLLCLRVPADDVHKAGLVANLAAHALLGVKLYAVVCVDQGYQPPFEFLLVSCRKGQNFAR